MHKKTCYNCNGLEDCNWKLHQPTNGVIGDYKRCNCDSWEPIPNGFFNNPACSNFVNHLFGISHKDYLIEFDKFIKASPADCL